ncbi:MAG: zinc ABC transporter substrate-binding protein, partial [Tissierellia bacterium]|nr:zinc ABC transporter substrate-binding protein [Tissierellia bacterium]
MKRRILILLAIAVSISFLGACSKKAEGTDEKKLSVYSSFYPVWDFTSKIGGDKIDNKLLVPMGTEAHDWEPSTTDIANLEKADVLVINGAGMESWSDSIIDSLSNENLSVIVAADGIDLMEGHCHHDHDHENCDHDSEEDKHEDHDACCEDHAKKDGHQDHDACCEDHAKKD